MVFDVLVVLAAVAVIGFVGRRADKRVAEAVARMERETQARAAAIDKQAKVFVRKLEASRRVGEKALDQSRILAADAKQLHGIVNEFMSNRSIRRMIDRGGE